MTLEYGPRGILQIDNARIVFKNFAGKATSYNAEGQRNFGVVIPNADMAEDLRSRGWNVKERPPRDKEDAPLYYLPVKVKFNEYGPKIYLRSGEAVNKLNEKTCKNIDKVGILYCDMDIRPYDWVNMEGTADEKRGRSAYLVSMDVVQAQDRIEARYAEEEAPDDDEYEDDEE